MSSIPAKPPASIAVEKLGKPVPMVPAQIVVNGANNGKEEKAPQAEVRQVILTKTGSGPWLVEFIGKLARRDITRIQVKLRVEFKRRKSRRSLLKKVESLKQDTLRIAAQASQIKEGTNGKAE